LGCGGSTSKIKGPDFKIDFNAKPSGDEEKLHSNVKDSVLQQTPELLAMILKYGGCEVVIRKALNEPGAAETVAWEAVSSAVDKLYEFYSFSLILEKTWPQVLQKVCQQDALSGVRDNLCITAQIANIFSFVFHFDEAKMMNPAIQNDFSYYRRVLGRMKDKKQKMKVDEELANKMSFFFAYPTPMMKVMIDSTTSIEKSERPRIVGGLSMVANLCLQNINSNPGDEGENIMLLLCAMTGCIILVDHLREEGAFDKKSPLSIKNAITHLKSGNNPEATDFLLNSLRFTTLHLNSEYTMPAITKLLA
jgi:hypothetical protein